MGVVTGNPAWVNSPSKNSPLSAVALNKIEKAIDDLSAAFQGIDTGGGTGGGLSSTAIKELISTFSLEVNVKEHGAKGDGSTLDTAAINAAQVAAGPYGTLIFPAGNYKVTGNLANFWRMRKRGPGVITDGTTTYRIDPRYYGDTNTIWVNGSTGLDTNDGLSPTRGLKTLAGLASVFEVMGTEMQRGFWKIRLSGTIVGGRTFSYLPTHRLNITFEGDPLSGGTSVFDGAMPTTWIIPGTNDAFGMRFEAGQLMRVTLKNLGFRGFVYGEGYGWIMKRGGHIEAQNCRTEGCDVGSGYISVDFSEQDCHHTGALISGTRAQYGTSGGYRRVRANGNVTEGFHVSRNAVVRIDIGEASDNGRDGIFSDMSTRTAVSGVTAHRNVREGFRGEGSAEMHIDDVTEGPNNWGDGTANANGKRGYGKYGNARITGIDSIYAIEEKMIHAASGSNLGTVVATRALWGAQVGEGSRIRIKAWGSGAGSLSWSLLGGTGATSMGTNTTTGNWIYELFLRYNGDSGAWEGYRLLNGVMNSAPLSYPRAKMNTQPRVISTPTDGSGLCGFELYYGG